MHLAVVRGVSLFCLCYYLYISLRSIIAFLAELGRNMRSMVAISGLFGVYFIS